MEQSHSGESNRCADIIKFPRSLWNPGCSLSYPQQPDIIPYSEPLNSTESMVPNFFINFNIIFPITLKSSDGFFLSDFSLHPSVSSLLRPSHPLAYDQPNDPSWWVQVMKRLIMQFSTASHYFLLLSLRSWDSSVGIATGYRLDEPGSIPGSARFFSTASRPTLAPTQPPIQ
jgi:hypothetical protein